MIFIVSFIHIADAELFRKWGNKINSQVFLYITHPAEVVASAGSSPVWVLLFLILIYCFLGWLLFFKIFKIKFHYPTKLTVFSIAFPILLAANFLLIRGGIGVVPLNNSHASFSNFQPLNTAAVNSFWNSIYQLAEKGSHVVFEDYQYYEPEYAEKVVDSLFSYNYDSFKRFSKVKKPNVIIVALESWPAAAVGCVGGHLRLTPEFDKWSENGLLFTKMYASGDRTEKGLVTLLTGFPAQPMASIINETAKYNTLHSLTEYTAGIGYQNSFYYGGDVGFANMQAFLLNKQFQYITDIKSFTKEQKNSKWGAHDGHLFRKVIEKLNNKNTVPFFAFVLTLSSHEPFEVPMETKIQGNDEVSKFSNSIVYSDKALGAFLKDAEKQPWYPNTLIVLVSDHGHDIGLPEETFFSPVKYHIPCMITGGALDTSWRGKTIPNICSQNDLAATLALELGDNPKLFRWSRPLQGSFADFACYSFYNGFGWVNKHNAYLYDNISRRFYDTLSFGTNFVKDNTDKSFIFLSYQQELIRQYSGYK